MCSSKSGMVNNSLLKPRLKLAGHRVAAQPALRECCRNGYLGHPVNNMNLPTHVLR